MKIRIIGEKDYLRQLGKTLLGDVNKLFVFKSLLKMPSNNSPLCLKQTFKPIIRIFTEGEGDVIESRLPVKIFCTLIWTNNFIKYLRCYQSQKAQIITESFKICNLVWTFPPLWNPKVQTVCYLSNMFFRKEF